MRLLLITLTLIGTNVFAKIDCYPTSATTEVCRESQSQEHEDYRDQSKEKEFDFSTALANKNLSCPSGYQVKNEYEIWEKHIRFKDEGEFSMCLNQDRPELHNAKDNWGMSHSFGSLIRCGNIFIRTAYSPYDPMKVKSKVGWVNFDPVSFDYTTYRESESRRFAKNNKVYKETSTIYEFKHQDSPKRLESKNIVREIMECQEVTF